MRENIGRDRVEIHDKHYRDVYNAILNLDRTRLDEIESYLNYRYTEQNKRLQKELDSDPTASEDYIKNEYRKHKMHLISRRTIQRCIKENRKIKRDGWHFFIDKEAQFEIRYQYPAEFGQSLYTDFVAIRSPDELQLNPPKSMEFYMNNLITRMGMFMTMIFLEAAKPFKDKSLSHRERSELVSYWINGAIPIETMYRNLMTLLTYYDSFNPLNQNKSRSGSEGHVSISTNELDEIFIKRAYTVIRNIYPELYEEWTDLLNWKKDKSGIRGKIS